MSQHGMHERLWLEKGVNIYSLKCNGANYSNISSVLTFTKYHIFGSVIITMKYQILYIITKDG